MQPRCNAKVHKKLSALENKESYWVRVRVTELLEDGFLANRR